MGKNLLLFLVLTLFCSQLSFAEYNGYDRIELSDCNDQQKRYWNIVKRYAELRENGSTQDTACSIFREDIYRFMDSVQVLVNWKGKLLGLEIEESPSIEFLKEEDIDILKKLEVSEEEYNNKKEDYVYIHAMIKMHIGSLHTDFVVKDVYRKHSEYIRLYDNLKKIKQKPFEYTEIKRYGMENNDSIDFKWEAQTVYFDGIIKPDIDDLKCNNILANIGLGVGFFDFYLLDISTEKKNDELPSAMQDVINSYYLSLFAYMNWLEGDRSVNRTDHDLLIKAFEKLTELYLSDITLDQMNYMWRFSSYMTDYRITKAQRYLSTKYTSESEYNKQQNHFFNIIKKYGNFSCCDSISEKQCEIFREKVSLFMDSVSILENWKGKLEFLEVINSPESSSVNSRYLYTDEILGLSTAEYDAKRNDYVAIYGIITPAGFPEIKFSFKSLYLKDEFDKMLEDIGIELVVLNKDTSYYVNKHDANNPGLLYFDGVLKEDISSFRCIGNTIDEYNSSRDFDFILFNINKQNGTLSPDLKKLVIQQNLLYNELLEVTAMDICDKESAVKALDKVNDIFLSIAGNRNSENNPLLKNLTAKEYQEFLIFTKYGYRPSIWYSIQEFFSRLEKKLTINT